MRHRHALHFAPALLGCLLVAPGGAAQDRPLVEVKPSLVDRTRRAPGDAAAPKAGKLERAPGRSLEDLRRELERIEVGERAGGPVSVQEKASASSSHTRRVVVENGEVIVDEETRDGRPVPPSSRERATPRIDTGAIPDAGQMLRELERELLRDLPELRLPKPGAGSGSSHSHTRRIVVRNGETIVDEETVDGRPVRPGARGVDGPRPEARASSSSSHTRRQVVRDGRVVVDEETVDGRPVRPGAKPPVPDDRMQELLREMEQQLVRDLERQGARDAAREVSRELERVRNEARDGRRGKAPERGSSKGAPRSRGGRR